MPVMLTVLPVPAFLSAKAPLAEPTLRLSPPMMPAKLALPVSRLAAVVPS